VYGMRTRDAGCPALMPKTMLIASNPRASTIQ
jgi:hypothetical protein